MSGLLAETVTHFVAFLIFFWVLKRYAWDPLMDAMDHRKAHIRDQIESARAARQAAEEAQKKYEERLAELEQAVQARMAEAMAEAKRLAEATERQARQEASWILKTAREQAEVEMLRAKKILTGELADLVVQTTEKVLADVLDDRLHQKIVEQTLARLAEETQEARPS